MFLQVQGITMWSKTKHVIQLTGQFIQLNILVAYIEYEIYILLFKKKEMKLFLQLSMLQIKHLFLSIGSCNTMCHMGFNSTRC
jgi:uncharacterized membrane protein